MNHWSGSYGIMMTPFMENGAVNFQELERQVDRLCQSRTAGIVVCGSSSEFVFCTPQQNMQIMEAAARAANGRKRLIGGATSPGRDQTLLYLRHMETLEFDGALIAPPYYFNYEDEEVAEFYREIAAADTVPIIAYNVPFFTNKIGAAAFEAILSLRRIEGIKNSGQNIKEITNQVQIRTACRPDFAVLTGTEDALVPCLAAGCEGGFTAFGALLPDYMADIYALFRAGEYPAAHAMQNALLPLLRLCSGLTFPLGYKLFSQLLGHKNSYIPQSITERQRDELKKARSLMETAYREVKDTHEAYESDIRHAQASAGVWEKELHDGQG